MEKKVFLWKKNNPFPPAYIITQAPNKMFASIHQCFYSEIGKITCTKITKRAKHLREEIVFKDLKAL